MHMPNLDAKWWRFIAEGKKTIECRLLKEKWTEYKEGDDISFTNRETSEVIVATISKINKFDSFAEALRNDYACTIPDAETFDQALSVYTDIYGEQDAKFGVIALHLKLVSN